MPEVLICDWNGTLIGYSNEKPLLESLASDIYKSSIPSDLLRILRMSMARPKLKKLLDRWYKEKGIDFVVETYRIFNENVINGISTDRLYKYIDNYANSAQIQQQLDNRLLDIVKAWYQSGKVTGIFSAACACGIERILRVADYFQYIDFVEANGITRTEDIANGIEINIFGHKRAHRFQEDSVISVEFARFH